MLVRVNNKHDEHIKNLFDNMKAIMEVINLMAEYNLVLLIMQIGEQLYEFKDVLVYAVQQLHHRSDFMFQLSTVYF
jgi:hypothetical protein